MDSDVEEEFQDAFEYLPVPCTTDLEASLEEAKKALNFFLNNRFNEAQNVLRSCAEVSMYHALGLSVIAFLDAVLTFERPRIESALEALKNCITVCSRYKRNNAIYKSFLKKVDYDSYSPEEIHAELCYAEALFLRSVITFLEDETLGSFIKAGIKIRACFNSYKECSNILHSRHWNNESHKVHFEGGVRMGVGSFNLLISILPARVIKLLEFIGFSGSKEIGLQELEKGYRLKGSIRQVLCALTLLGYHLIVIGEISHTDGDLKFCDEILKGQLQLYPQSMLLLFLKGRLEFMSGHIDECIKWYMAAKDSQNIWPHFHHLCFWELFWANGIKQSWREASTFAQMLLQQSKWSRTVYSYQRAVMLLMLGDNLTPNEKREIEQLMRDAPQRKQKIAGRSLPIENFIVKKSERFFTQKQMLVLPAIELLYVWNLFKVLGKNAELSDAAYNLIYKAKAEVETEKKIQQFSADNQALVMLLEGAILRQMNSLLEAEKCLNAVLALEKQIQDDLYLIPFTMVELALVMWYQGNSTKAAKLLDLAKKKYSGYALESRLHFMAHTVEIEIKEGKQSNSLSNPMPSTSTTK